MNQLSKPCISLAALTLAALSAGVSADPPKKAALPAASVSYEKTLAPLFNKSCAGCHNKETASSGYDMSTTEALFRGGNRGNAVVPGKAKESLLYRYLVGTMKPVMPLGGAPLKPAEI